MEGVDCGALPEALIGGTAEGDGDWRGKLAALMCG